MPITPEQFTFTLENMASAWEATPEAERLPRDEESSFFDDLPNMCREMIQRWHAGTSSHPDKEVLAGEYADSDEGVKKLVSDIAIIRSDPFVQAAELNLKLVKYSGPERK
eukprot:TRINITY_DN19515_c0_g1_i1.p3 TRINITY_DN19515_c0_g1~~TRINITY_DN19515_c0_g1_i1.p3  ORF type:complete len:110 (+),score=29.17 TRINITY_DN19515_c0_g1_i1:89-418(+)